MALTPEEIVAIQKFVDLAETHSEADLAKEIGLHRTTISNAKCVLRRIGVSIKSRPRGTPSKIDIADALARLAKEPITDIAASYGVKPGSIIEALARHEKREAQSRKAAE